MPKFTLICDHSYDGETHVVTHEFNTEYLPDVLMNLDMFLKGSGYVYDGFLTVEEPEELEQHSDYYYDRDRNRHPDDSCGCFGNGKGCK